MSDTDVAIEALVRHAVIVAAWQDVVAAQAAWVAARTESGQCDEARRELAIWERAIDRCAETLTKIAQLTIGLRLEQLAKSD